MVEEEHEEHLVEPEEHSREAIDFIKRRLGEIEEQLQNKPDFPVSPHGVVLYEADAQVSPEISPRFRHLNFETGAEVDRSTDTVERADIVITGQAGGRNGCGPFEYNYLVDGNWAAIVAAGDGTEGEVWTTFHGHTFKVYSTIQAAVDSWEAVALAARPTPVVESIFIVTGTYAEQLTPTPDLNRGGLYLFGSGMGTTIIKPSSGSGNVILYESNSQAGVAGGLKVQDLTIDTTSMDAGSVGVRGTSATSMGFEKVAFVGKNTDKGLLPGTSAGGLPMPVSQCIFATGIGMQLGVVTSDIPIALVSQTAFVAPCVTGIEIDNARRVRVGECAFTSSGMTGILLKGGVPGQHGFDDNDFIGCAVGIDFRTDNSGGGGAVAVGDNTFLNCTKSIDYSSSSHIFNGVAIGDNDFITDDGTDIGIQGDDTNMQVSTVVGNTFQGYNADNELKNVSHATNAVAHNTTDSGATLPDTHGTSGAIDHPILDGDIHEDSVADAVTAGSLIVGNDTPKWDELDISVPAATIRNMLGIDNGETVPSWKADSIYSLIDGSRSFTGVVGGIDPTASNHLATKEYVDSAVSFIAEYHFNDTASDIGGIYTKMLDTATGDGESTFTSGSLGQGDNQALFNFATDAGVPGITALDGGIYGGHIHVEVTIGNRPTKIHYEIYSRATDTTETLVATSEESDFITSKVAITLHATLAADVTIAATDRLIIKWLANVDASPASNVTIALYAEGTTNSHLEVPTSTEVLSSVFLRQDGTTPLSGNWDAGSFKITAQELSTDTISEEGAGNGVTIDGVLLKDGLVDGVDVAAHKDRHDPEDGADPLDAAAAIEIVGVQAASEGNSHSFSRANHGHQIKHGIVDNHVVTVDGVAAAEPNSGDYARWTALGLEGKSPAEVVTDLSLNMAINAVITNADSADATKARIMLLMPCAGAITNVEVKLNESETCGATSLIVDIHKVLAANAGTDQTGTTLYTTQGNRPTVTNTTYYVDAAQPDVTTFAAGDWLCFYIDVAGTNVTTCTIAVTADKT